MTWSDAAREAAALAKQRAGMTHGQEGPGVRAQQAAETHPKPHWKKAGDFEMTGEHYVKVGNKTATVFFDRGGSNGWHDVQRFKANASKSPYPDAPIGYSRREVEDYVRSKK